eukprot:CAMPEP_0167750974 /NCGR_PEP_ID=MMETSP0110_2-20121227/6297_1 /TAXON_ID=629695 /ORGANISM="Gymnochlora sp., Strain CCMP2014" /LENGTH=645 /DNA_ID=CAMNT_0007636371 /DNA_START=256 /DNA_END=2189 /DNA_ORIENTATION=-
MEILRELGLEDDVHKVAPPLSQWRHFRYMTSMLGEELGSVDFFRGDSARWLRKSSPASLSHLSQPILDSILDRTIDTSSTSPRFPGKIRRLNGYRGESFEILEDNRVKVSAVDIDGSGGVSEIFGDYLVAADGANSMVRRTLNIDLQGESALQHFVSVHFTCSALWPRLRDLRRPGMLHFVFSVPAIGVLVAHNFEKGEWVAQFPYYPPHQTEEEVTEFSRCEKMIKDCIGAQAEDISVEVHSADAWCMNGLVADSFSDEELKVFLVGDSAHQFPPSGGFGLNAGMQDAHNLAWKLASVLHKQADKDILTSYSPERKSVCTQLKDLSVDNFYRGLLVPEALALPPVIPGLLSQALDTKAAEVVIPNSAKSAVLETVLGVGRALNPLLSTPAMTLFKAESLRRLRVVLENFKSLPLLFPHHDLGLEYNVPGSLVSGTISSQKPRFLEGVQQYQARLAPGARLPHIWFSLTPHSNPSEDLKPLSSLDLCSHLLSPTASGELMETIRNSNMSKLSQNSPRWILLLDGEGPDFDGEGLCGVARVCGRVASTRIVGDDQNWLATSRIREKFMGKILEISRLIQDRNQKTSEKVPETIRVWDAEGAWSALVAAAGGGKNFGVLVRPDGHIGWVGANATGLGIPRLRSLIAG